MKMKIITIVVLLLALAGISTYQFLPKVNEPTELRDTTATTVSADPACDVEKKQDYNAGFGVEHRYEGEITPGKKVIVTLSCDHEKFTITGAVNQIITGDGVENTELADLSSGEEVVYVAEDYNFDGYNDLSTVIVNGSGWQAIDTYLIFLYNPKTNTFEYNTQLSGIENIGVDRERKMVYQYMESREDGYRVMFFSQKDSGVLYPSMSRVCQSDRAAEPTVYHDRIQSYVFTRTAWDEKGKEIVHTSKRTATTNIRQGCPDAFSDEFYK